MPELLIELFGEEIPARMQQKASADLRRLVTEGLIEAGLTFASAGAFATPRRLALSIEGLSPASKPVREERKGPRVDAPDKAIEGFLRSTGLQREQLECRDDKKGQVWFAIIDKPGRAASDIVAEVLREAVHNFPWSKSMRWGSGTLRWVRPLHSVICLLSDEGTCDIVNVEISGIQAGRTTQGHRFMAPEPFDVFNFDDYAAKLKSHFVILNPQDRADMIWNDAQNIAFAQGLELVEDRSLLSEVAGLVEWPVVLIGDIDPAFLALPAEVLQTSMREHQKFFSLRNPSSGKIEKFATAANVEASDGGKTILAGNKKVLAARLSDAVFFWENDLRATQSGLEPWVEQLKHITFHAKLGSQAERVERITALAEQLAPLIGADPAASGQAARIAKADLVSEMVYEFPELQGIMGRYYAQAAGTTLEIAQACQDHYAPLGPSDAVPTAPISVTVALADKLDLLMSFWSIDEKPTGSRDPFALRRAALGVIRLLTTNALHLNLRSVFAARLDQPDDLLRFLHDRLKVSLREQGVRHDVIEACIGTPDDDDLTRLVARAHALGEMLATQAGEDLLQGFRRANNLLTQAEQSDGVEYSFGADPQLAQDDVERALFKALTQADHDISSALKADDYTKAMSTIAALRDPIDGFFERHQVNVEGDILRRNRLNLLGQIRKTCAAIVDLEKIQTMD